MNRHHTARLDRFTPVTEFGETLFPSAIAFLLAWLLLSIWLRERERARERRALLEQISSVEAEYESLWGRCETLKCDCRELRNNHQQLHREFRRKEEQLASVRAVSLSVPPAPVDPPVWRIPSWDPPPPAPKSWANSYQALYHSNFSDGGREDWERGLRDDGLDIRRAGVGLHTRSETEEAGVYPIIDEPQGNFYLLIDPRAQITYVLPDPWVQFNSRNLTRQLEPFYVFADSGSGAIERILDPARVTSIGDPRWRVEQKGQIQFKGSVKPPSADPPAPDSAQPVPPNPTPVACAEPRRRANLPPAADTWVPNYVTLYNSYAAGWPSEAWEEVLETGGIDFRRVEVSLLPEETFLLPENPRGIFYILTDAHSRSDYYLVPAPWCHVNSLTLMQQIRAFYACSNLGSGRVERLLEAAQVARGSNSWRVERRGSLQFRASTNISQSPRSTLEPSGDSAQLLQQPTLLPEVWEHCPLLPSFPPPHCDPSTEVACETPTTPVPNELDACFAPELVSSPQNEPHTTITRSTEPTAERLPSVPAGTEIPEVADTDPPLSERLGRPPHTPASDEGTLKPAELLNRYRMVALKVHPLLLDHKACQMVMFDAFDELNLALSFSGVTFSEGVQDEVRLDRDSHDFALVRVGPECFLLPLPWLDYVDPDPSRSRALRALFDRCEGKEYELLCPAVLCQQSHDSYRVIKKGQVKF